MIKYLVVWEIDVEAESPQYAAELAWQIMRRADSTAIVFDVFDGQGSKVRVDLEEVE